MLKTWIWYPSPLVYIPIIYLSKFLCKSTLNVKLLTTESITTEGSEVMLRTSYNESVRDNDIEHPTAFPRLFGIMWHPSMLSSATSPEMRHRPSRAIDSKRNLSCCIRAKHTLRMLENVPELRSTEMSCSLCPDHQSLLFREVGRGFSILGQVGR